MSAMTDDEQLESLKSFTKKYGSSIIIGILVALIAFSDGNIGRRKPGRIANADRQGSATDG